MANGIFGKKNEVIASSFQFRQNEWIVLRKRKKKFARRHSMDQVKTDLLTNLDKRLNDEEEMASRSSAKILPQKTQGRGCFYHGAWRLLRISQWPTRGDVESRVQTTWRCQTRIVSRGRNRSQNTSWRNRPLYGLSYLSFPFKRDVKNLLLLTSEVRSVVTLPPIFWRPSYYVKGILCQVCRVAFVFKSSV